MSSCGNSFNYGWNVSLFKGNTVLLTVKSYFVYLYKNYNSNMIFYLNLFTQCNVLTKTGLFSVRLKYML